MGDFHIQDSSNCCRHKLKQTIFQKFYSHFWRVFDIWPICAAPPSAPQQAVYSKTTKRLDNLHLWSFNQKIFLIIIFQNVAFKSLYRSKKSNALKVGSICIVLNLTFIWSLDKFLPNIPLHLKKKRICD